MNSKMLIYEYDLQFFAQDGPGGEKTEPATSKKLEDARKDGKVVKSKELTAAFDLVVLFLVLKIFIPYLYTGFLEIFDFTYSRIPEFLNIYTKNISAQSFQGLLFKLTEDAMLMLLPIFGIGFLVTFVVSLIQVGWRITGKPLKPDLTKFNPISGFKRILSKDSIFELLKSFLKIGLIAFLAYRAIVQNADVIFVLYDIPLMQAMILCGSIILNTGLQIALTYLIIGIADWIYQKYKFTNDMKMTKQEVKDEMKNTEGNPEIKGRQRQRMREASQRRMMQDVPKADVIITNPTHLAVAIRYDSEVAKAPIVVAKGEDSLALKIREVAKEAKVEIVENKPLARMLYTSVDVGKEIPQDLYQAVAEVLAMVYNLNNKFS
ncbi:MAG: flagellar biosynthesis protein FlhB [Lachnospiraceae bacterium]